MLNLCSEDRRKLLSSEHLCKACAAKIERDDNYLCSACAKTLMDDEVLCKMCIKNVVRYADSGAIQVHRDLRDDDPIVATIIKRLTSREKMIVAAIVDGSNNKEIAELFNTSQQVIKNGVLRIFNKTGFDSRLALAVFVLRHPALLADIENAN